MRWFNARNAVWDLFAFDREIEDAAPRRTADLLEDYAQSGAGRRLHLWLDHRDLRPMFNAVADMGGDAPPGGQWTVFEQELF